MTGARESQPRRFGCRRAYPAIHLLWDGGGVEVMPSSPFLALITSGSRESWPCPSNVIHLDSKAQLALMGTSQVSQPQGHESQKAGSDP